MVNLALPFDTEVLGALELVVKVDANDAQEIGASGRRNGKRQATPILYLPGLLEPAAAAEWIEACRRPARGE